VFGGWIAHTCADDRTPIGTQSTEEQRRRRSGDGGRRARGEEEEKEEGYVRTSGSQTVQAAALQTVGTGEEAQQNDIPVKLLQRDIRKRGHEGKEGERGTNQQMI